MRDHSFHFKQYKTEKKTTKKAFFFSEKCNSALSRDFERICIYRCIKCFDDFFSCILKPEINNIFHNSGTKKNESCDMRRNKIIRFIEDSLPLHETTARIICNFAPLVKADVTRLKNSKNTSVFEFNGVSVTFFLFFLNLKPFWHIDTKFVLKKTQNAHKIRIPNS